MAFEAWVLPLGRVRLLDVGVVIGFEPLRRDSAPRSLVPKHQYLDLMDYPEAVKLLEKESFLLQLILWSLHLFC